MWGVVAVLIMATASPVTTPNGVTARGAEYNGPGMSHGNAQLSPVALDYRAAAPSRSGMTARDS